MSDRIRELRAEIHAHLEAVYRLDCEIRALAAEEASDAPETPPDVRSGEDGGVNSPTEAVVPWWEE